MKVKVKKLLEHCGEQFKLDRKSGKDENGYAVIMPLRYKNKQYVEREPTELGDTDDGCYKYLGPFNIEPKVGDTIAFRGKRCIVQRVETVFWCHEPLYFWAVLRPYYMEGEE